MLLEEQDRAPVNLLSAELESSPLASTKARLKPGVSRVSGSAVSSDQFKWHKVKPEQCLDFLY